MVETFCQAKLILKIDTSFKSNHRRNRNMVSGGLNKIEIYQRNQ